MSKILEALKSKIAEAETLKPKYPLYTYQQDGVEFLTHNVRSILGDDVGLGKTIQIIATIESLGLKENDPILVICTVNSKGVWKDEFMKWNNEEVSMIDSKSGILGLIEQLHDTSTRVKIVNYEQIRDLDAVINSINWRVIICDEAHKLKNPKAKTRKTLKEILHNSWLIPVYLVTGTPLVKSPTDLWSLLNLIRPDIFQSKNNFIDAFYYRRGYGDGAKNYVVKNADRLRSFLAPYILRREQDDALDLPPFRIITDHIDLWPEQKELYRKLEEEFMLYMEGKDEVPVVYIITQFLRARQICLSAELAFGGESCEGPKTDKLMDLVEEYDGKLVVFSEFTKFLKPLFRKMKDAGIACDLITGDYNSDAMVRRDIANRFQNTSTEEFQVLLLATKAAGESLTLTAAKTCVFMDRPWSAAAEDQAFGRIRRNTQTERTIRRYYEIPNSIEQYILSLIRAKRALSTDSIPVAQARKIITGGK